MTSTAESRPVMRSSWQITKSVWYALILREIQVMFFSRRFGAFWVVAEPIANIVLLMLIFSFLRGRMMSGLPFPLFLLTGIVPFFMMRGIVFGLMGALDANRSLFIYRQVKPFDAYVARAVVQVITQASVYVLIAFGMVFFLGYQIPVHRPLELVVTLSVMIVFALALGIVFSIVVHALPDLTPILRLLFFPLYLISGIIFPLSGIPAQYHAWLLWNPFLHLISEFRQDSLAQYTPIEGVYLNYPAEIALIMLFVALLLYRQRQYQLVTS